MPKRRRGWLAAAVIIAVHLIGIMPSAAATELADVVRGLRAIDRGVRARSQFYVRYTAEQDLHRSLPGEAPRIAEIENAKVGNVYFFHSRLVAQSETAERDETWALWKDGVYRSRMGGIVTFEPAPNKALYNSLLYWQFACIDVFDELPILIKGYQDAIGGVTYSAMLDTALPRSIELALKTYTVRPSREVMYGADCDVVERAGRDTLWIDSQHGHMWRKRQMTSADGRLTIILENPELGEVEPGLWLPWVQRRTVITDNGTKTTTLRAVEFTLGDQVRAHQLVVPIDDNVRIMDGINKLTYVILPKNKPIGDLAEDAIRQARRIASPVAETQGGGFRSSLLALNVMALLGLVLYYVAKR
jgi:hypothetical protein